MLSWIFTGLTVVTFIVLAYFVFNKNMSNGTKIVASWIGLSVIATLNILTYAFVSPFILNLVVGILLFIEIVVQACMILGEIDKD